LSEIKKTIIVFGSVSIVLLLLFQLGEWSLYTLGGSENLYIIISGVLFLIFGMSISRYFFFKKEKQKRQLVKSSLSAQEIKVLNLIAGGSSNKEIAEQLFIAETTVKSHVSNILTKLNAKRRTEAVKIGKELRIV
jgi:DNA-binding CsgD family transcriptional regulator